MSMRVGLVGAGPWAGLFHAPMIRDSPHTTLEAVWARRPEAAEELTREHGGEVAGSFEELLERVDAVAFAVPPDVQGRLAPQAARAGKHLVLEKPLAFTLEEAEEIADAVDEAGVRTVLMLRNRFTTTGRAFVEAAKGARTTGAQASFVTGAALEGSHFATPWRIERGAVWDVGPHVLDLLEAGMGPIEEVTATGDPLRWVSLVTRHESGALGQVSLSITTPRAADLLEVRVWSETGPILFEGARSDAEEGVGDALMEALAVAVTNEQDGAVDVHSGLRVHRLLVDVEQQLAAQGVADR
ncbi:Gfo/Idh/MocA family oxidoreductase [Nocardioides korecus]